MANDGVVRLSDRRFASRANFLLAFLDRLECFVCLLEGLDLEPGELVQLPLFDEFRIRFLECRGCSPSQADLLALVFGFELRQSPLDGK